MPLVRNPAGMNVAVKPGVIPLPGTCRPADADLARYVRTRFGCGMFLANLCGAIDVYVLLGWVLPTPEAPSGTNLFLRTTIGFVVFMAITFPLGGWGTYRAAAPVGAWLTRGGPPTPAERR